MNEKTEPMDAHAGMAIQVRVEGDRLHVEASGKFSLKEAKRTFLEMLEAVARNKVENVLLDGRSLTGSPQAMERFYYGEFAAQMVALFEPRGVYRGTRFAYVLKVPVRDPERLGETVAVNRGMFVRVFDEIPEALHWLAPFRGTPRGSAAGPDPALSRNRAAKAEKSG